MAKSKRNLQNGPRGGNTRTSRNSIAKCLKAAKKDKMDIVAKEGSLSAAVEYESIYPDPGAYNLAKLPYFVKVSKIREIIYCAEGICNRKTYMDRRNIL